MGFSIAEASYFSFQPLSGIVNPPLLDLPPSSPLGRVFFETDVPEVDFFSPFYSILHFPLVMVR